MNKNLGIFKEIGSFGKDDISFEHINNLPKNLNEDGDTGYVSPLLYQLFVSVLPMQFKFLEIMDIV